MSRSRPGFLVHIAALAVSLIFAVLPSASAEPPVDEPLSAEELRALEFGAQLAPKGEPDEKQEDSEPVAPNPYLANVPDPRSADYAGWNARLSQQSRQRAKSATLRAAKRQAAARRLPPAVVHDEEEPAGTVGANDSQPNAEPVSGFGTGPGESNRVRVLGELADLTPAPSTRVPGPEDNGQLSLATATLINGSGAIRTTGVLGDGPHGPPPAGDGTNDFDFYRLTSTAGRTLTVDTSGSPTGSDTYVAVYSAAGQLLATDDDGGTTGLASLLRYQLPADGAYFVLVAGYATLGRTLPQDPNNSGSGRGGGDTGDYTVLITAAEVDLDFFAFDLAAGDVIGATVTGGPTELTVYRLDGTQMVGAEDTDVASGLYPPESPLPGGGNTTFAYVAEEPGSYAVQIDGATGRYDAKVEAYRPGSETDQAETVQTVFLDFDGARVNTAIWGGPGVRELSPFSAFIAKWGLTRAQEAALVTGITTTVEENVRADLIAKGLNPALEVRVINSREEDDPFGQPNVSRVIIGGTIAQSGISTIGIAQFIDPGNYNREDSAVVLLDVLSNPTGNASLNTYLNATSDRVGFVSRAVGNVTAHEIGHLIGNFHTDNANDQLSLMDAGGLNFGNLYGVGPDGVGGTADDLDTDYTTDAYSPSEVFTGFENTLNVSAWAFVRGQGVPSP